MNKDVFSYCLRLGYPGVLITVLLIVFMLANRTFSIEIVKKILNTLLCAFFLLILECVDFYIQEVEGSIAVRQIIGSINYFLRIGCVGFCALLAQRRNRGDIKVINFTLLFLFVICIANIWIPLLFKFNEDQSWIKGPLFYWSYVLIAFYCYFYLEASIKQFYSNRGESLVVLSIMGMCIFANVIELLYNFKTCLPTTYIICILFYFLCLNIQMYRRDTLTNLLNRRSFYIDLKSMRLKHFYIISMDLNNLKLINDNQGHNAGDQAICASSRNMERCFTRMGKVYRTGGDEFMGLIRAIDESDVQKAIENFQQEMKRTKYTVACGYAEYKPGLNVDSVIEESDSKMYVNKKYLKEVAQK